MKWIILILAINISLVTPATKKKVVSEKLSAAAVQIKTQSSPAIIAIEIVDPKDNATAVRSNTKRTIESNLGYGYQSDAYNTQKKFMVYPYSQQDIPASKGSRVVEVQKAITYNLGTRIEPDPKYKQTYQTPQYQTNYPATLYSTIDNSGHISHLSSQFPQNIHGQSIPVIILRVYSNQLSNPYQGIYPNLPQSHPQASYINTINLQALLGQYLKQSTQQYYQPAYQQPEPVYQQEYQQTYQPVYQQQYQEEQNLPTHENYPDDAHTRVIYHSPKGHIQTYNSGYQNPNLVSLPAKLPSTRYLYKPAPAKHSNYQPATYNHQHQQQQQQQQYYDNKDYYVQAGHESMKTNTIYTDANGQSYIYVLPSQLKGLQQEYYTDGYENEQEQPVHTEAPYNYHAHDPKYNANERSKKSSGRPVMFEETPPKQ